MVVSRCLLRLSGLRLRVLGLDGRDDLRNPCKAFHAFELLFAVQQHRPQPPLKHHAASCACDIPLTVPHQREHAFDRVGRQQRRQLQPMHRQQLLERLQERIRCHFVLGPQPRLPTPTRIGQNR
jgi:hypothetical protein